MKRSKKLVVMCHCLLNSNSKIFGLSFYQGALLPVVNEYLTAGAGLIQLPCPEMTYLGLKRWGMTRDQYDTPFYRRHCVEILRPYVDQIIEYSNNGYRIEAIVGVDGSPSCGVNFTCEGYCGGVIDREQPQSFQEVTGQGVFIRELAHMLKKNGISLQFDAINENNPL
ncbi:MAG: CD3072 family TudS-related putative desulfidase [Desulfofustis sp.]|nr:CD3072 family TudS-related putative desulfidase [Desulfofustis sp.]